jgi:3-oxoacyl-[acyl-carrier-protein] synthase-1
MSNASRVYVAGVGMITPIGADAVMTFHSVNTDISRVGATSILNRSLNPVSMALVPDGALPEFNEGLVSAHLPDRQQRLLRLASAALSQLADKLPGNPLPLYLALPEQLPDAPAPLVGNVIEQLVLQSEIELNQAESMVAPIGRAGGLHAVRKAHQYFAQPGHDYVLIGGVDTYWDPYLLAKLSAEGRLSGQGNMDGFTPGEGAAFLLLASERVKEQLPEPHIALAMPGCTEEAGHRYSDEPYRGEGMAQAVTQAFERAESVQAHCVWTSMIYDHFSHKELAVALTRNSDKLPGNVVMRHPVDCLGDVGAAIGCALVGMIAVAAPWQPNLRHHLVCCASDLAHRAALRVDIDGRIQATS